MTLESKFAKLRTGPLVFMICSGGGTNCEVARWRSMAEQQLHDRPVRFVNVALPCKSIGQIEGVALIVTFISLVIIAMVALVGVSVFRWPEFTFSLLPLAAFVPGVGVLVTMRRGVIRKLTSVLARQPGQALHNLPWTGHELYQVASRATACPLQMARALARSGYFGQILRIGTVPVGPNAIGPIDTPFEPVTLRESDPHFREFVSALNSTQSQIENLCNDTGAIGQWRRHVFEKRWSWILAAPIVLWNVLFLLAFNLANSLALPLFAGLFGVWLLVGAVVAHRGVARAAPGMIAFRRWPWSRRIMCFPREHSIIVLFEVTGRTVLANGAEVIALPLTHIEATIGMRAWLSKLGVPTPEQMQRLLGDEPTKPR